MVDLILRFRRPVLGIGRRQLMHRLIAALKNSEVCYHGIPVVFRKGGRIVPAMPDKITAALHQHKALPGALDRCRHRGGPFLRHLRQILLQLRPRIAKLRAEMDALHQDRLLLAMIEARKPQDAAFIYAGLIPVKLNRKALLYPAEGRHVAVLYDPVGMQGFTGFYDKRRFQRERFNLFKLFV